MGPEFFQTKMGRQYYQKTLPDLVRSINRLAASIEGMKGNPPVTTAKEDDDEYSKKIQALFDKVLKDVETKDLNDPLVVAQIKKKYSVFKTAAQLSAPADKAYQEILRKAWSGRHVWPSC